MGLSYQNNRCAQCYPVWTIDGRVEIVFMVMYCTATGSSGENGAAYRVRPGEVLVRNLDGRHWW